MGHNSNKPKYYESKASIELQEASLLWKSGNWYKLHEVSRLGRLSHHYPKHHYLPNVVHIFRHHSH